MANTNLCSMNTILITNKVEIAKHAQFSGVKIIMIDLETIGKKERQNNVDTFISDHKLSDLKILNSFDLQD